MKEILIKGEFIKLYAFLKFSGLFATGGNAKTETENGGKKAIGNGKIKITKRCVICF